MRIEEVHLRKVGPFEDVRIAFPPGTDPKMADVYLLTGPNGAGKSTVLYAIAAPLVQAPGTWVPCSLRPVCAVRTRS